jgi:hypothetical protein
MVDVVVVAVDCASAKSYNLRPAPNKWPRVLHSRLLERLMAQKAVVVAFELHFSESLQSSKYASMKEGKTVHPFRPTVQSKKRRMALVRDRTGNVGRKLCHCPSIGFTLPA